MTRTALNGLGRNKDPVPRDPVDTGSVLQTGPTGTSVPHGRWISRIGHGDIINDHAKQIQAPKTASPRQR